MPDMKTGLRRPPLRGVIEIQEQLEELSRRVDELWNVTTDRGALDDLTYVRDKLYSAITTLALLAVTKSEP